VWCELIHSYIFSLFNVSVCVLMTVLLHHIQMWNAALSNLPPPQPGWAPCNAGQV
jgi:hypothetical protein